MNDVGTHLVLFAIVSFVIVTIGAFYAERDDAAAFRSLPRRYAMFVLGCAVLTAVMLVCEHTLASVD